MVYVFDSLDEVRSEVAFARESDPWLSQAEVAARLGVGQDAVSKLERRADPHVSTLARYIRALGGRLVLTAEFPEFAAQIDLAATRDT